MRLMKWFVSNDLAPRSLLLDDTSMIQLAEVLFQGRRVPVYVETICVFSDRQLLRQGRPTHVPSLLLLHKDQNVCLLLLLHTRRK